ncbi:hypothetical protein TWF281_009474 [Arthrobotrys megalospora]
MRAKVPASASTPTEYHLQITNYKNRFKAENRPEAYRWEVNSWLQELLVEGDGDPTETCPLWYSSHYIDTVINSSGVSEQVVKLAFRLRSGILHSEFDKTLKKFCERLFCKDNWDGISRISGSKLKGLSPVEGTRFADIWNSGFLLSTFREGGENLLQLFNSTSSETRPPGWLKAICFIFTTPFTGEYNFGAWATKSQQNISADEANQAECIELDEEGLKARGANVARVCELWMESAAEKEAVEIGEKFRLGWIIKLKSFAERARLKLDFMKEILEQKEPTDLSLLSIGSDLLGLAEQAANICTNNREAMQVYRDVCVQHVATFGRGVNFCMGYLGVAALMIGVAKVVSLFSGFPGLILGVLGGFLSVGFIILAGVRTRMTLNAKGKKERYREGKLLSSQQSLEVFNLLFEISTLANNVDTVIRYIHSPDKGDTDPGSKVHQDIEAWWGKAKGTWKDVPPKTSPQKLQARDLKIILEETVVQLESWGESMGALIKKFEKMDCT